MIRRRYSDDCGFITTGDRMIQPTHPKLRRTLLLLVAAVLLGRSHSSGAAECKPASYSVFDGSGCLLPTTPGFTLACNYQSFYCDGTAATSPPACDCNDPEDYIGCPLRQSCSAGSTKQNACAPTPPVCNGPNLDPNCTGRPNANCATCKNPFASGSQKDEGGSCCENKAGGDPILLSARAAATEPYTDLSVDRVSTLSITRSYNSADYDLTASGATGGVFGRAWHHDWEAYLTCDGEVCSVARGTLSGFNFSFSGTRLSLDGSESWDVYLPDAVGTFKPPHQNVLVRRPSGTWSVFMTDGRELQFQTVCTSCDPQTGAYCKLPETGGRARLVKVVDARGNSVRVGYDPAASVLLRLTDDLGHALELRSGRSCAAPAYATELRYDGSPVARYTISNYNLTAVTDPSGGTLRSYVYSSLGLPKPRLTAIQNEAGSPIVEFSYDANGYAIGVADAESNVAVSYAADAWSATVTEFFRGPQGDTTSSSTRSFDYAGLVTSISGACACGPAKSLTRNPEGQVTCSVDADGRVVRQDRDELGRVIYRTEYSGESCAPPATLPADSREEWREYGVTREIAQGVLLPLDVESKVWRRSTLVPEEFALDEYDYDQRPKDIDPPGYACTRAPLPGGSVVCREVKSGYVTVGAAPQLERHATFYSYDEKGRLIRRYGPVALDVARPGEIVPVEEWTYWSDGESAARQGRLREVRQYPSPSAQPLVTSFDYDAFGVSRITAPDGTSTIVQKDVRGRPTMVSQVDATGVLRATSETRYYDGTTPRLRILASGAAERYTYDLRGRLTVIERFSADPEVSGGNAALAWVERYTYDQSGNRIHSERADGGGNVVWAQDRAYDVRHRVVWEGHPSLASTGRGWEYDGTGFLLATTDEEGRATRFMPDGLGRVQKVQRAGRDSRGLPASVDVATYLYGEGSDALAGVVDANGRATEYRYDDFGRLEQLTSPTLPNPEGRRFRHDVRGNLVG